MTLHKSSLSPTTSHIQSDLELSNDEAAGSIEEPARPSQLEIDSSDSSTAEDWARDRLLGVREARASSWSSATANSEASHLTVERNLLLSVFGEARPSVILFRCVVPPDPGRPYSTRASPTPSMRFYYHHSSAVHRYNCVINTLDRNGGVAVPDGAWDDPKWSLRWDANNKPESLKKMHTLQKTNHFPGSFQMGWKDSLCLNIDRLQRRIGPNSRSIVPPTYILPKEFPRWDMDRLKARPGTMWIYKPRSSSCGRGIKLLRNSMGSGALKKYAKKSGIIQRYIGNPLLLNGLKCDLRLYVLVTSVDPLKIYLYDEGLVRIATQPYVHRGKSKSRFMHLTNYSVNKRNSTFVKNEDKRFEENDKGNSIGNWEESGINYIA
ncbi:Tubulin polyglutamylase ttll4 [Perkinsus chesapeaki]|uniref:Tubulin--tyrosine ligase-like protein 5 n=1 Tax=Perkinsus chesapeaki TaxID=330153 RepID=A0A7J6LCM0_PERCH|nr:Tubulin polyglutamylase ttll4 [Perkinsus chesapeaki]